MSRRVAFLFPGQGAKRADAALRAAVRSPGGRARCELAARAAGVDLAHVLARPSLLDRTDVYQPVITAVALAAAEALAAAGIAPAVVLGHSLGEVAAWSAAGAISTEDAIELAALRGRLMAREAAAHPGGMVALATSDEAVIEAALAAGRRAGALELAARNAPDETVLTGDEAAVRAVLAPVSSRAPSGPERAGPPPAFAPIAATRVPTAGAWHGPGMAGALEEWRGALHRVRRAGLRSAFVANRTGEVVTGAEELPDLLAEQLVRPVAWTRALATVGSLADVLVTLGPGAVLRSLWHRNTSSGTAVTGAGLLSTEDERSLAETIAALRPDPSVSPSSTAP